MKILIIFGTRPEAIKMAPLVLKLRQELDIKVCVTGQHREMLDQVLKLFKIIPDYDLNLMKPNQNLANLTGEVLNGVTSILRKKEFHWVLVQGDTHQSRSHSPFRRLLSVPGRVDQDLFL